MTASVLRFRQWRFKSSGSDEWMPAVVPGCVHADLLRNRVIADPFGSDNERELQWIDKLDWDYETRFDVPAEMLLLPSLELEFDGLDTYADVSLNDRPVLSADNMFRRWSADVKGIAAEKDNVLRVVFRSPVREDLPKLRALGIALPAANDQSELGGLGDDKISVFARKAPYHYGWDWGPRFVTSGIWREARLAGWRGSRIADFFIRQDEITAQTARLTAQVEVRTLAACAAVLRISEGGRRWERQVELRPGTDVLSVELELEQPRLWWCRGLGKPERHAFKAELLRPGDGEPIDEATVVTGLRTVRLNTERDERGSRFVLELNGVPVFAKGANHIPHDSFPSEVPVEKYRAEVEAAAECGMNMLRVWGGGLYEDSAFYNLCDEHGLMVWQDFMFACSMYPSDDAFLASVAAEAEDNLKRLRRHPSLVLWCGNNEIDSAWSQYDEQGGWGWKGRFSAEQRSAIWSGYEKLFHVLLPRAVEAFSPGVPYWPSSPLARLSGDAGQHGHADAGEGDVHYWGVWHGMEPFEAFRGNVGRFMSEYGFQSFPQLSTIRTYAEESELELESRPMLAHQKHGGGNQRIRHFMNLYMSEPKDFPSFVYRSQVLQAEAMKEAMEAHRRAKPYCMGSLYWQMNDCWPAASWSGIDYFGHWKALQYQAKRSFRETLLSFGDSGGLRSLHAVTDRPGGVRGRLTLRLLEFDGTERRREAMEVRLDEAGSSVLLAFRDEDWLGGLPADSAVLVAALEEDGGAPLAEAWHYFVPLKQQRLERPRISVTEAEDGSWTVSSDTLARQVRLTAEQAGRFSDNFFDVLPGLPRTVSFHGASGQPARPGRISWMSMQDTGADRIEGGS